MESKKWYGLTIPKKVAKVNTKGKSVFENDDSDEGKEDRSKIKKETPVLKEKKKRAPEPKPDEVDPNIYEYDSIYDDMKASQKQKTSHSKTKESRYINLLLKAADKRKKESERRVERKIQAERVKEGDAFKDKEAFVTSAYRQKMIEMEEEEERERRESALEEMMDSTKQKDLSGFYRHFLKQTVGEERIPEFGDRDVKLSGDPTKKNQDCSKRDKSRQRSESPSGARFGGKHSASDDKDDHGDVKQGMGKPERRDSGCSSEGKHRSRSELGHSRDKTSSHKKRSRHQSSSSSDSESKKGKLSAERSNEKKSDHSSKSRHDRKARNSCSSRDQEDRMYDRDTSGHHKSAPKQTSTERHSSGKASDPHFRKSKLDRDVKEHKTDARTDGKTEKGLLQTSAKTSCDEQIYDTDKKSLKIKISEVKKQSEKRENESNDVYSDNKRRKYDDDDDDDSSSTSSVESEVKAQSDKEEAKEVHIKPKADMVTKFAKRTVGKIFDDAQARYFKRRDAAKAVG